MKKNSTKILLIMTLLCISLTSTAATHNVTVSSNTFTPAVLNIEAGDTVIFSNTSGFHNVKADDGSFRCSTNCESVPGDGGGAPSSIGWVTEITFNSVGSFNYFCEIHGGVGGSGMSGIINVVAPTSATVHQVLVSDFEFTPSNLVIEQGDFVNFIRASGFHNVRADDDSFICSEACEGSGKNLTSSASPNSWNVFVPFNTVGDVGYYCEPHGGPGGIGMSGVVTVQSPFLIFANGFEAAAGN
jgi:plastocyanin